MMLAMYTLEGLLQRLSPIEEVELPDAALMAWTTHGIAPGGWKTPRRALDLDCGLGTHARYLARRKFQVDALSRDAHALSRARDGASCRRGTESRHEDQRLTGIRFIHAEPLDFKPDRPYDLVVDYGCFFRLRRRRRRQYLQRLDLWTLPGSELILLIPRPRWSFALHPLSHNTLKAIFQPRFRILEKTESSLWSEHTSPLTRALIGDRRADVYRFQRRG